MGMIVMAPDVQGLEQHAGRTGYILDCGVKRHLIDA
jgi:hypothetical protein